MTHYEFEKITQDGINLYIQVWQTDQNAKGSICIVHGLGEHSGRYTQWAKLLNQAGFSVITFDLRGHGKSTGKRGHIASFDDYLRDLDLVISQAREKFSGLPIFLYGHSLGGMIVAAYVLKTKPELNGVIITALPYRTSLQEQKGKILLSKILGSLVPGLQISSGLIPETICSDPAIVDTYNKDPLVHHQVTVGWGKNSLATLNWLGEHVTEWKLPVLFMHGELDKLGYSHGTEEFARKIDGDCTLKIWPGMFHEIHNEPQNKIVFDYLCDWLNSHLPDVK